ncbi:Nucleotide-binding universal stress protein, UspA family [Modicisalibacter ilicicola DSM 19980]|uniref:Nucleotide-binding universal stress protein, UspA family n=1 Tax=Modicisalibacter ilicicola DSM 19980 TaxID=1121942 RepID=A0A1M5A3C1_9GAMM|nr:universal stress protein [Halomonas ilicicola]SHF24597.1 Nucleotide-binding universal stress protein, UspA family [Halomonas ilicicola DSM 19980]
MHDKIVLPVDLNAPKSWEKALPEALALCKAFDAELFLVTVLPDYRMPLVGSYFPADFNKKAHQALSEAQHRFVEQHIPPEIKTQCVIADGSPYEGIIKSVKALGADLVVMASHNKRRFADYLLGPNAEHVMRHAGISVLIVR